MGSFVGAGSRRSAPSAAVLLGAVVVLGIVAVPMLDMKTAVEHPRWQRPGVDPAARLRPRGRQVRRRTEPAGRARPGRRLSGKLPTSRTGCVGWTTSRRRRRRRGHSAERRGTRHGRPPRRPDRRRDQGPRHQHPRPGRHHQRRAPRGHRRDRDRHRQRREAAQGPDRVRHPDRRAVLAAADPDVPVAADPAGRDAGLPAVRRGLVRRESWRCSSGAGSTRSSRHRRAIRC